MRIGCQGWNYEDWVTKPGGDHVFYPAGTASAEMLAQYASVFDTVEVDSTFYGTPSVSTFEKWYKSSSEGFLFAPKLPREITHELRLKGSSQTTAQEFIERARILKEKLGPVLVQLPPSFSASRENARALRQFLGSVPGDVQFAVEFRDPDWLVDWTLDELGKHNAMLCAVEGQWIDRDTWFRTLKKLTGRPVYVRFMGARDLEQFDRICRPRDEIIRVWHREIAASESSAFVYFSNLLEGFAPASANKMRELSGQGPADLIGLQVQNPLF